MSRTTQPGQVFLYSHFTDKESECQDRFLVGTIHSQQLPARSARSLHSRPLPISPANTGRTYTTRTRTRYFPQPHSLPAGSAHMSRTRARSLPTHSHRTPSPVQRKGWTPAEPERPCPMTDLGPTGQRSPQSPSLQLEGCRRRLGFRWGPRGSSPFLTRHHIFHRTPEPHGSPWAPTLTLRGSPATPSACGPGGQELFPTSSWRPRKDEPGGGGGVAHAQREDATVREAGELELSLSNLGWKSGSTLRSDALLLNCQSKLIVIPR